MNTDEIQLELKAIDAEIFGLIVRRDDLAKQSQQLSGITAEQLDSVAVQIKDNSFGDGFEEEYAMHGCWLIGATGMSGPEILEYIAEETDDSQDDTEEGD